MNTRNYSLNAPSSARVPSQGGVGLVSIATQDIANAHLGSARRSTRDRRDVLVASLPVCSPARHATQSLASGPCIKETTANNGAHTPAAPARTAGRAMSHRSGPVMLALLLLLVAGRCRLRRRQQSAARPGVSSVGSTRRRSWRPATTGTADIEFAPGQRWHRPHSWGDTRRSRRVLGRQHRTPVHEPPEVPVLRSLVSVALDSRDGSPRDGPTQAL